MSEGDKPNGTDAQNFRAPRPEPAPLTTAEQASLLADARARARIVPTSQTPGKR